MRLAEYPPVRARVPLVGTRPPAERPNGYLADGPTFSVRPFNPMRRVRSAAVATLLTLAALAAGCSPTTPPTVQSTSTTPPRTQPRLLTQPPLTSFLLLSSSFISSTTGWVFGESPCSAGRCFAMFATDDGATTWSTVPPPPFAVSPTSYSFDSATIAFANAEDGWAYDTSEQQVDGQTGDQLFSTHDGGSSWTAVSFPNDDQSRIQTMAVGNGQVWMITFDTPPGSFPIYGSPVEYDDWTRSAFSFPLSAGPVTNFSITLQGDHGWIVENDRGVITGASLEGTVWSAWTPPCSQPGSYDGESVAAVSATYVVALCPPNLIVSKPPPTALYASQNAGESFLLVATGNLLSAAANVAASPGGALFAFDGPGIIASFDGGANWQTVVGFGSATFPYADTFAPYSWITFVTSSIGFSMTPTGHLIMTSNGGQTWQSVGLPST